MFKSTFKSVYDLLTPSEHAMFAHSNVDNCERLLISHSYSTLISYSKIPRVTSGKNSNLVRNINIAVTVIISLFHFLQLYSVPQQNRIIHNIPCSFNLTARLWKLQGKHGITDFYLYTTLTIHNFVSQKKQIHSVHTWDHHSHLVL